VNRNEETFNEVKSAEMASQTAKEEMTQGTINGFEDSAMKREYKCNLANAEPSMN
jgi:hypothetical protein